MSEQDQMPDRLGPYRLLDRIGEGGMGVVFLARDAQQRSVALKVLRPSVAGEPTARRRLAREVETMRRVRSPFVAEVIDADLDAGMPYIVTRYVPGRTLDEVVNEDGPLRRGELAMLAHGLAQGIAAVHAAGVVHRDLKPGNVMLVNSSPVVIDFGIAQGADTTRLTMTGMFMGTPGYLSPEVIEGHPSSEASDIHAWGATLAFAATGRPPFGAGPYETIFFRIVHGEPDLAGVPAPLLPLLSAAMARDPARRPSAASLVAMAAAVAPEQLVPAAAPAAWAGQPSGQSASATRSDLAGHSLPGSAPWGPPADDYADLLPPASYQPGPGGVDGGALVAGAEPAPSPIAAAAAGPASPRVHAMIVLASVALLIGLSVALPVAGTGLALALIVALRAGEISHISAVRRRSRGRGSPVLTTIAFPWHLSRALLATFGWMPFAVAAGVVAIGISLLAAPYEPMPRALSLGAGALVAFYGIGPGSGRPRRQLGRLFAAVTPTRLSQVVALAGLVLLALAVLSAAITSVAVFWPAPPPTAGLSVSHASPLGGFGLLGRYLLARLRGL